MFHSTHMKDHPNEIIRICLNGEDTDHFETFLQIAHGVRGRISYEESHLKNAYVFGLRNVKQLIDQELKWQLGPRLSFIDAISDDLNHCVAEWFRAQRNVEGLKKVLSRVDIDVLPGEVMKKCAMFFFGI
uniref:BTB domain-containing protein n=1 Tax=Caenorhabditis tropicalis TaxID=1561998 RepID=A0A1I7UPD1_9PELO